MRAVRILVVKTSSLGDVIHTLPAVTDAARAIPGLAVDWVVERDFAAIPAWHPAVVRVVPVAVRSWRKRPLASWRGGEIAAFRASLRGHDYDAVIDAQGLMKSAALALAARGPRHGLGFGAAREGIAAFAYRRRHAIPKGRHAIWRTRALFAAALGYALPESEPDYGLARERVPVSGLAAPYVVLLHGTTWGTKQWPVARWREIAVLARGDGFAVHLPAHGEVERARAAAIADGIGAVLPPGDVAAAAGVIAGAAGVVAVDTGLAHLAAALGVPAVTLYGATAPELTGTVGASQRQEIATGMPCIPCRRRVCAITGKAEPPPCLDWIAPAAVWSALKSLMAPQGAR
jgi:heptosyltransferase-1